MNEENVFIVNNGGDQATPTDSESNVYNNEPVEFASSTDSTLYTVQYVSEPLSVAEQDTAILLEIRNILLIFLLAWLVLKLYQMLKNTIINFFER